jgi:antirestriction protein ArdC
MSNDLYQDITNQVLQLMEQHGSEWVKPWTGAGIPINAETGKEYQGTNILVLGMSAFAKDYQTNYWATYKQWQSLGAHVMRGEKSTVGIFFTHLIKEDDRGEETKIPMIKAFRVFNADQVEGWTAPEQQQQGEAEQISTVELFVANTKADIRLGNAGAFYMPGPDVISMPHRESFTGTATSTATEAYYGTLLHELGHWSGAKHRLSRDLSGRFGTSSYAMEELVAELTSAFLSAHLDICSTPRADHAQYLNHWVQKLTDDARAFLTAASAAQKAADYLRGLQPAQEDIGQAA